MEEKSEAVPPPHSLLEGYSTSAQTASHHSLMPKPATACSLVGPCWTEMAEPILEKNIGD
jgi:hypothetical protein